MPYARQDYRLADIQLAFRSIDTAAVEGANFDPNTGTYRIGNTFGKGKFGAQPVPHADIHGADELHRHPLFAAARISMGGATTHSVMDENDMQRALLTAFNSNDMQPFLQQLDNHGGSVNVNVNFNNPQYGTCKVFTNANTWHQNATTPDVTVLALVLKIRANPANKQIPIIQTCIPHTAHQQVKTKKGKVVGITI